MIAIVSTERNAPAREAGASEARARSLGRRSPTPSALRPAVSAAAAAVAVVRGLHRQGGLGLERAEARAAARTLLVLDTQTGEPAEALYVQLGYARTGVVPAYARFPDGRLGATTFMHKLLA